MFDPISLTILGISCLAGSMAANASYHQEKNPETKKKLGAAKDGLAVAGGCMAVGGAIANAYNQNKNLAQQLPSSSGTLSPSQQFWNTPIRQQVGPILQVPPLFPPGPGGPGGC